MKSWRAGLVLFLAAAACAAVSAPTSWPTVFPPQGGYAEVAAIADYLNEPIYAARAAYGRRLAEQGKPAITTEAGWDAVYLPVYPRDGWRRYGGWVPDYQIIGPVCIGGFGLHEFQGQTAIRARIDEMNNLCFRTRQPITPGPAPTVAPPPAVTTTRPPAGGCGYTVVYGVCYDNCTSREIPCPGQPRVTPPPTATKAPTPVPEAPTAPPTAEATSTPVPTPEPATTPSAPTPGPSQTPAEGGTSGGAIGLLIAVLAALIALVAGIVSGVRKK